MKTELKKYLTRITEQKPGSIVKLEEGKTYISICLFLSDKDNFPITKDAIIFNYDPLYNKKIRAIIYDLRKYLKKVKLC